MGHAPGAIGRTLGRAVQLYASDAVAVNTEEPFLGGRQGVNKWFTLHSNLHTALSLADTVSKTPRVMMPVQ